MVFWWTGRGFLSLLFLIGVVGAFGALVTFMFGDNVLETRSWLWGVGVLLAVVVNWFGGSRLNRRSLNLFEGNLKTRLFYRARNRFCSLPMETWSVPLAVLGLVLIVRGAIGR